MCWTDVLMLHRDKFKPVYTITANTKRKSLTLTSTYSQMPSFHCPNMEFNIPLYIHQKLKLGKLNANLCAELQGASQN